MRLRGSRWEKELHRDDTDSEEEDGKEEAVDEDEIIFPFFAFPHHNGRVNTLHLRVRGVTI